LKSIRLIGFGEHRADLNTIRVAANQMVDQSMLQAATYLR
jgi:hypothetical protein